MEIRPKTKKYMLMATVVRNFSIEEKSFQTKWKRKQTNDGKQPLIVSIQTALINKLDKVPVL